MRLVTFTHNGADKIGALNAETNTITDFATADPSLPSTMQALIERGRDGLDQAQAAIDGASEVDHGEVTVFESAVFDILIVGEALLKLLEVLVDDLFGDVDFGDFNCESLVFGKFKFR